MSGSPAAAAVVRELDRLGLAYEILPCDPTLADTEVFCAHYGVGLDDSANTIVVASKSGEKRFAVCVVLASTRLDVNRTVRKRLGVRRISFASAQETIEVTGGMVLGGVTPVGLPASLPLWVDSAVMERDAIVIGGGDRETKIRLSPRVFDATPSTTVVPGLATRRTPSPDENPSTG